MVHGTATAQPVPPIAAWIGFIAMCIGMFMAILDIQIVATSLPSIQEALAIRPDQMSWIQTSYLIAEVVAIPLTGWLTRVLSLRGLFVVFTAVFVIASAACASSTGFASLVTARVVQGFAGGVLIPIVFSAGFLLFPGRGQALATTIAGVLAVLAPTVGPIAGGWITSTYSWQWLFLINVVPGILAVLVGFSVLPRSEAKLHEARHLDLASLILVAAALAALEIGLKEAPRQGWASGIVLGLFLLALTCGTAFVQRTLSRAMPIVDLRLLADRNFALGCALSFILGMGLYGSVYLMPVFLAYVRNHGPLTHRRDHAGDRRRATDRGADRSLARAARGGASSCDRWLCPIRTGAGDERIRTRRARMAMRCSGRKPYVDLRSCSASCHRYELRSGISPSSGFQTRALCST